MTISAQEAFDADDMFARNVGLYRDLSVALQARVTHLMNGAGETGADAWKEAMDAAKSHQRQLQTVLELEASLVRRCRSTTRGGGEALDLDAARAEILERLARWTDGA